MSLETLSRVVSAAHKSAAAANGGTPDEQGAVDILGGLSALLESRLQLHKHATLLTGAAAPTPIPATSTPAPTPPPPAAPRRQSASDSADSYDLK